MEESGWKLVHGDVFRPPQYPMILSSLLGSGIQLFCMVLIVICEWAWRARCGGLSPEQCGPVSREGGLSSPGKGGTSASLGCPSRQSLVLSTWALAVRSSSELPSTVGGLPRPLWW